LKTEPAGEGKPIKNRFKTSLSDLLPGALPEFDAWGRRKALVRRRWIKNFREMLQHKNWQGSGKKSLNSITGPGTEGKGQKCLKQ